MLPKYTVCSSLRGTTKYFKKAKQGVYPSTHFEINSSICYTIYALIWNVNHNFFLKFWIMPRLIV